MANLWIVLPGGRNLWLALAASALALGTVLLWPLVPPGADEVPEEEPRSILDGRVIAIDPGHGGFDPGVKDPATRLVEKEITLDVAMRLAEQIKNAGGEPVLTREEDVALGEAAREDLDQRLNISHDAGAEAFISLHVNSFPDPIYFGAQTFYYPGSEEGQRLAELLQEELVGMQPDNFRLARPEDFYLLRKSAVPAAVVELGFMTSERDRLLLASAEGREQLARVLTVALARYFAGHEPAAAVE